MSEPEDIRRAIRDSTDPEWVRQQYGDRHGIGGNQPPITERAAELIANCDRWMAERPTITDAEQAGLAQGFIDQLRGETAEVEAAWKKEREPFDIEIALLRTKYREPLTLLGIALAKMKRLADGWLDKEKARLAREAAERKRVADEAAAAAVRAREEAARAGGTVESEAVARQAEEDAAVAIKAASKPIGRARIKGEFSSRAMSQRAVWSAEIVDEKKALLHYGKHVEVRAAALEAIRKIANREAKQIKSTTGSPPGVAFRCDERAA